MDLAFLPVLGLYNDLRNSFRHDLVPRSPK